MEHHFNTRVAETVGVEAAVILQNIVYWCDKNRLNGEHFHDGMYWTYNSNRAFQEQFPYLSKGKIERAITKLQDAGLVEVGNYSGGVENRTRWFAVTELGYEMSGMAPTKRHEQLALDVDSATPSRAKRQSFDAEVAEVMAYLNGVTGRSLSAGTNHIRARLRDGATVEQCKRIIDLKQAEWGGNPNMRKYVRPATLFCKENFEKYMDELGDAEITASEGVARYAQYD